MAMASTDQEWFRNLNFNQVQDKEDEFKNANSAKNEKNTTDAFKAYLRETKAEPGEDLFTFTEEELDLTG